MTLLKLDRVSTRLQSDDGWVHALDDLSLSIARGKTFALVGESGCGKSMTALSIARLLPDSGAVVAGEVRLTNAEHTVDLLQLPEQLMRAVRGKRVSLIFQEPGTSLNPVMTVEQQLVEVILTHNRMLARAQAVEQAAGWLDEVGLDRPQERLKQYPFQLSGGQKQRVMIAIALAAQPDLLIADEPTTALDVSIQAQVLELLKKLQRQHGMAMLLITHDLGIVSQMADHVALMYAGQIVESAATAAFFSRPQHPYAIALLNALPDYAARGQSLKALGGQVPPLTALPEGCRFASRCERAQPDCIKTMPDLVAEFDEHWVRCWVPQKIIRSDAPPEQAAKKEPFIHATPHEVLLHVRGLQVAYRSQSGFFSNKLNAVVNDVDFRLHQGKTLAIVGESGSGKSTIAKAVLQLLADNAQVRGSVLFQGHEMLTASGKKLKHLRRAMQVVFQDPFASLNPKQRVQEILREGLHQLCPELTPAQGEQRIARALEDVSLPANALQRFPHEFSGGQRQRIAIARALVVEPRLLILDEPTSALDVSVQAQVLNLLKKLQQERQMTFLLITHNLAVVEYMADDVMVLRQGKVLETGSVSEVMQTPRTEYTRQLIDALPRVLGR